MLQYVTAETLTYHSNGSADLYFLMRWLSMIYGFAIRRPASKTGTRRIWFLLLIEYQWLMFSQSADPYWPGPAVSALGVIDAHGYKRLKVGWAHFAARLVTDACGSQRLKKGMPWREWTIFSKISIYLRDTNFARHNLWTDTLLCRKHVLIVQNVGRGAIKALIINDIMFRGGGKNRSEKR